MKHNEPYVIRDAGKQAKLRSAIAADHAALVESKVMSEEVRQSLPPMTSRYATERIMMAETAARVFGAQGADFRICPEIARVRESIGLPVDLATKHVKKIAYFEALYAEIVFG